MSDDEQYISDIIIANFQSHKDTHLELSPGVNALIGDTGCGKSALFRALIWFFINTIPKGIGDEYRSYWGGDTEVAICIQPENLWLGRVRSATKNYYWIDDDSEKNRLAGFGSSVPEEISKLLNLGDVNFQAQMTLPFLLSLSSGKAGKFFNDAADLDIIDRSISNIDSLIRKEKALLDSEKLSLNSNVEKLKAFDWVDNAHSQLLKLEEFDKEIKGLDNYIDELDQLADGIEKLEIDMEKAAPVLKAEPLLNQTLELKLSVDDIVDEISSISDIIDWIDEIEGDIEKLSNVIRCEDLLVDMIYLKENIDLNSSKNEQLLALMDNINRIETEIEELNEQADFQEKQFHKLMPMECPLCGKVNK